MKKSMKTTGQNKHSIANFQVFAISKSQQQGVKGGSDGDENIIIHDVVDG